VTPHIVLDILGVDPSELDPDPLLFKSIGEGSKQLNYSKGYSGSDVPGPAWPESPGLGSALEGSGLYKSQAGPSIRA